MAYHRSECDRTQPAVMAISRKLVIEFLVTRTINELIKKGDRTLVSLL
ncbi:MAG TPA: hypothetical protein V6D43_18935 [Candidatus Sericytochromatia bacterium]